MSTLFSRCDTPNSKVVKPNRLAAERAHELAMRRAILGSHSRRQQICWSVFRGRALTGISMPRRTNNAKARRFRWRALDYPDAALRLDPIFPRAQARSG